MVSNGPHKRPAALEEATEGRVTYLSKSNTLLRGDKLERSGQKMRGPTGIIGLIVTIVVIFLILRFLGLI